jgi:hypothetical protein
MAVTPGQLAFGQESLAHKIRLIGGLHTFILTRPRLVCVQRLASSEWPSANTELGAVVRTDWGLGAR